MHKVSWLSFAMLAVLSIYIFYFYFFQCFAEGKARFRKQSKWTMDFNWQYNVLRDYLLDPKNGFLADGKLVVHCEVLFEIE